MHCPALSHVLVCDSPSKTQPEAEHREQHTGCFQRHQETSTPSHQDFLSRQWYCHGPEELGDRRIILSSPTENSWDFVWPLACHPYYKLILSRKALLLENGSHRHRFVLHSRFISHFRFLLVNHTEIALGSGRSWATNCRWLWEYSPAGSTQAFPIPTVQESILNEACDKVLLNRDLGSDWLQPLLMQAHSKVTMPRTHCTSDCRHAALLPNAPSSA